MSWATRGIHHGSLDFVYRAITFFGSTFQWILLSLLLTTVASLLGRLLGPLGCSLFARRYLGNLVMIYFPGVTRMFRFTPYPGNRLWLRINSKLSLSPPPQSGVDFSIRKPPDQRFMAPSRRVSPPYASFLGQNLQGIHYRHYE